MKASKSFATAVLIGLALVFGAGGGTRAEPLAPPGTDDDALRFTLTPYANLPLRSDGVSTIRGTEFPYELDHNSILSGISILAALRGELWKGRYGLIADLYYYDLDTVGSNPMETGGDMNINGVIRQSYMNLMGAYRLGTGRIGEADRRYALDISGGLRWNRLEQGVDMRLVGGPVPFRMEMEEKDIWWEPIVSARATLELSKRWSLASRLDLSGFGTNGDRLQYLFLTTADWHFLDSTSLKLGYKFYGMDFETALESGDFGYKNNQNGPFMGLSFRF